MPSDANIADRGSNQLRTTCLINKKLKYNKGIRKPYSHLLIVKCEELQNGRSHIHIRKIDKDKNNLQPSSALMLFRMRHDSFRHWLQRRRLTRKLKIKCNDPYLLLERFSCCFIISLNFVIIGRTCKQE